MPPPASSQGSRGGLVAAVVAFTILFVASTIVAIYYGVQDNKAEESLTTLRSQYKEIASDLSSPDVSMLREEARSDQRLEEPTAMAEAIRQRDDLRQIIVGLEPAATQPTDVSAQDEVNDAIGRARQAIAAANTSLGATNSQKLTTDSLVGAVNDLSVAVTNLASAVAAADQTRDQAFAQADKDSQAARDVASKAETTVAQAKDLLQQQLDAAADAVKKAQDSVSTAKQTFQDEQNASSTALEGADTQIAKLTNDLSTQTKQIALLGDKLSGKRVNVLDPIIRRPEGSIVSVADQDTVYINIGEGDHVVPGLTFEVYDKTLPLPKLGDGLSEDNLPEGKASIEVLRVLPDSSVCHVNHLKPGEVLVEGDPIMNLVYDPNGKYNFYVYGDFDINRTGKPTPAGADVIRRLIVQWGGNLQTKMDETTDFVVMGTPPDVPVYTVDDLKDPLNAQNLANAREAADKYDAIVKEAQQKTIPIMNQNRFLYFTGYYDVALR
jgi:hypothetical protein